MFSRLKDIATIQTGFSFREKVQNKLGGTYSVVQMKDLTEAKAINASSVFRTNLTAPPGHHLLKEGDILFRYKGIYNHGVLYVGNPAPAVAGSNLIVIRPHPDKVLPAFLAWCINQPAVQLRIGAGAKGQTVRMVNKAWLEEIVIPLPDMKTQAAIAAVGELGQREKALLARIAERREALIENVLWKYAAKEEKVA